MKLKKYILRYSFYIFIIFIAIFISFVLLRTSKIASMLLHPEMRYFSYFLVVILGIFFIFANKKH
nr:MAG TPA: protein of unknown function (DUF1980) [Caudoviricetes sp.]